MSCKMNFMQMILLQFLSTNYPVTIYTDLTYIHTYMKCTNTNLEDIIWFAQNKKRKEFCLPPRLFYHFIFYTIYGFFLLCLLFSPPKTDWFRDHAKVYHRFEGLFLRIHTCILYFLNINSLTCCSVMLYIYVLILLSFHGFFYHSFSSLFS